MKVEYQNEGSAEVYMKVMRTICGDVRGKSMLDVCCGEIPHTNGIDFANKTFVDVLDRGGASSNPNFIQQDIFEFFKTNKKVYDVAISSDSIEHFRRGDAHELLHQMDLCSDKQIVFTPLGAHMVETIPTDDPHSHKSEWWPEYFQGWASIVFPNFHSIMNLGAFFTWTCIGIDEEFEILDMRANQIL